jgi:hypothetical protein
LTSAKIRAHAGKRSVARGIEPPSRQAERSGKRGYGGGSSHLRLKNPQDATASVSLPAVARRLQDKPSAVESGGVRRQPSPATH